MAGLPAKILPDERPAGLRKARFERREDLLFWWEKRTDLLQTTFNGRVARFDAGHEAISSLSRSKATTE